MKTQLLLPDSAGIAVAAKALGEGRLVAFPTETVYGLGAAAGRPDAVREVFRVKGRPAGHPLIIHLADASQLSDWTAGSDRQQELAARLAEKFWPGALTLVLPRSPRVPDEVTGGQDTVAVRVPAHPAARELLHTAGLALVAPSANRFGRISPTTARHVLEELGGLIPFVLDGGPAPVGLESTILDLSSENPRILRPGMVGAAELGTVLGSPPPSGAPAAGVPRVSGSLDSHYAPAADTRLVRSADLERLLEAEPGAGVLAFRSPPRNWAGPWLTLPPDAAGAAAGLYAALRELDRQAAVILVELPPSGSAWTAVRDRLRRAAAARTPAGEAGNARRVTGEHSNEQ